MVLFVYVSYLFLIDWARFGLLRTSVTGNRSLAAMLAAGDVDAVFDALKALTFSEAMLNQIGLYMVVGTPVAIALYILEKGRVRWLQSIIQTCMPASIAAGAVQRLELYLWAVFVTFCFILAIGPFHLERPRAHYLCATCAITSGCLHMAIYLTLPLDFAMLAARIRAMDQSETGTHLAIWADRVQSRVRPTLQFVLGFHILVVAAGLWKASAIEDDMRALVFGICETVLIIFYQFEQAVFIVDDSVVGMTLEASTSTQPKNNSMVLDNMKIACEE